MKKINSQLQKNLGMEIFIKKTVTLLRYEKCT